MRAEFLPFSPPDIPDEGIRAVEELLRSDWPTTGARARQFEEEFAAYVGSKAALAVSSGTAAMQVSLAAFGVRAGDRVATTPLTFCATAHVIEHMGARPVFVDVDPETLDISPAALERALAGEKFAAIMPVHLYGQPADMRAITALGERYGLAVVEDCCQAHLATCDGRPVGSFGVAAAYSFYPTKNLGALGDGGAITTNDAMLAAKMKRVRNGGQTDRYHHGEMGVNSRLDDIQAAILSARLPYLAPWTEARRTHAALYRRLLAGSAIQVPAEFDAGHVYHLFPVLSPRRDDLQAWLRAEGIETLIHYPVPIPRQPALQSELPAACPEADRVCAQVCSLPIYPGIPEADLHLVANAIRRFPA